MGYRIRKYRKCPFETYVPEKRAELNKENAVPLFVRVCNRLLVLGGMIGFFVSSLLVVVLGFFGIKKKVKRLGLIRRLWRLGQGNNFLSLNL